MSRDMERLVRAVSRGDGPALQILKAEWRRSGVDYPSLLLEIFREEIPSLSNQFFQKTLADEYLASLLRVTGLTQKDFGDLHMRCEIEPLVDGHLLCGIWMLDGLFSERRFKFSIPWPKGFDNLDEQLREHCDVEMHESLSHVYLDLATMGHRYTQLAYIGPVVRDGDSLLFNIGDHEHQGQVLWPWQERFRSRRILGEITKVLDCWRDGSLGR